MAAKKLTDEMKDALLQWLAAGYSYPLIMHWFTERGWEKITRQTVDGYAKRYAVSIVAARKARLADVLETGAAGKAERIKRLADHADALEKIKWTPAPDGKLPNEKAWRETLRQLREEIEPVKMEITGAGGGAVRITEVRVHVPPDTEPQDRPTGIES